MIYQLLYAFFLPLATASIAAWHKGMYCLNGTKAGVDDQDNNVPVFPLFQLRRDQWWMQAASNCINFPPADGEFLDLPANGEVTVELATNRAFTSLSYNGQRATTFVGPLADGVTDETFGICGGSTGKTCDCIVQPNIHAQNESFAAGTAFAIAYNSDPMSVKPEELVVFTVAEHTPWRRLTTYQVPNLPKCPDAGCTCVWGWVPNGCGEPDIYMQPFRCRITGTPGPTPLATPAQPPAFCKANSDTCIQGAKQMIFWNQQEGNNVPADTSGGASTSPGYNEGMGWKTGRQVDIFVGSVLNSTSGGGGGSSSAGNGDKNAGKGLTPGAIAGIVIGIVALLGLLGLGLFFYRRRQRRGGETKEQKHQSNTNGTHTIEPFVMPTDTDSTRATSPLSSSTSPVSGRPGYHRKNRSNGMSGVQSAGLSSDQPRTSMSDLSSTNPTSPSRSSGRGTPAGLTKLERERERERQREVERETEREREREREQGQEEQGQGQRTAEVEEERVRGQEEEAAAPSERHVDAGPVPISPLQRTGSGRLPPAYGDIVR
ncbi:hypothetical protein L218DRAFT_959476 [Marasmius fiardii PR-910]|nr:hypothetical protein L218DRAFT_959476 [Marasmius fiardii PR-910]